MAKKDQSLIVPHEQVAMGIANCLGKANALLGDAKILLGSSRLLHASILFSFALEEFGKAVLLKEALDLGSNPAQIEGFFDHKTKLQRAANHIPRQWMQIARGGFQGNTFQGNAFQVEVIADLDARLKSLYVDWDKEKKDWLVPPDVDEASLNRNLDRVERMLTEKQAEWGIK